MAPTLYGMLMSPPCRSVRLAARALGVEMDIELIDIFKQEHKTAEFKKLNPQTTIPTLKDGDLVFWESRAILQYLANKYGSKDSLYPKDAKLRAQVDRMLFFDLGTLYQGFVEFAIPVALRGEKPNAEKLSKIHESLELLEQALEGHFFAVGNRITIADFALVVTVSTFEAIGVSLLKYSNVKRWLERCKSQMADYEELNGQYAERMGKMMKAKLRV